MTVILLSNKYTYFTPCFCSGEFMQLGSKEHPDERFNHYLEKTYKKTASLIACCCKAVSLFIINNYCSLYNSFNSSRVNCPVHMLMLTIQCAINAFPKLSIYVLDANIKKIWDSVVRVNTLMMYMYQLFWSICKFSNSSQLYYFI